MAQGPGRGRRDPVHHLGHDRAPQARDAAAPAACSSTSGAYLRAEPREPTDEYVSILPLPWIMEQVYVVADAAALPASGSSFPESRETAMRDLREIGPTHLLLAPRVWEQIAADVRARLMDAERADPAALRAGPCGPARGARTPAAATAWPTCCCSRPLRDRLGFAGSNRPRPAARRSAPTPSASSSPWACRCASSTARPRLPAPTRCRPAARSTSTAPGVPFDDTEIRDPRSRRERRRRDPDPPCGDVRGLLRRCRDERRGA